MSELKCKSCGAELLAGTSFCRQCGAAISTDVASNPSEQTTALLNDSEGTTQRIVSRATSPEPGQVPTQATPPSVGEARPKPRTRLAGIVAVVVVIATICIATVFGVRSYTKGAGSDALMYPGASTVVDMKNDAGGRALHLQTSDSFNKVEEWYQKNLKPEKTFRLTATSVVMKNGRTTATITADGNTTNILIKVTD